MTLDHARACHHKGAHDLAALGIRCTHHAALGHGLMRQQHRLNFRAGNVVAGRNDHVVRARLVVKIAVFIDHECVAGQVPAIAHILRLPRVGQITAAGGAAHRKLPHRVGRQGVHVLVNDARFITRHHLADGAWPHLRASR